MGFSFVFETIRLIFKIVPWWLILIVFVIYVAGEIFIPSRGDRLHARRLFFPPGRRLSKEVRSNVWKRDRGKCVECGSDRDIQFDHVIPFSKGGSDTEENVQLLCKYCNKKKGVKI